MHTGNLFKRVPETLAQEVFEKIVESSNVKIERIISKGHTSPETGWYDQENNEWVLVLKGAAIIAFPDATEVSLTAGDHLNIPAHKQHRVTWTEPDTETIWLAVHYR